MAVLRCLFDRLLVFMQQVCRKLVFKLVYDWIEDFNDAIKIHFVHAQHSCHCTHSVRCGNIRASVAQMRLFTILFS